VNSAYSQTTASAKKSNIDGTMFTSKNMKPVDTSFARKFAVHTPKKDTLFILKCEIGQLTYAIWKEDPKYKGHTPVIIMTDDLTYYEKKYSVKKPTFRN
jgi:hypothetical protein